MESSAFSARRRATAVDVGGVVVGGGGPVVVQAMTNTDTADADATAIQVARLAHAGSELVRITVNNEAAAAAVPEIVRKVRGLGLAVPIVGDFHYNGHQLLTKFPEAARALAKYRINPGNVGTGRHHDDHFESIVRVAIEHGKPVRIGVNWGSLDQAVLAELMDANSRLAEPRDAREVMIDAMVESAIRSAELAETTGLAHDRIILSAKVSGVRDLLEVYRRLAARGDYALHLGLTEAGMGMKGIVASSAGLSLLLAEGIGDTIRVSITPEPGGDRTEEVAVAQQVLQSLGLRSFMPQVSSCPGCGWRPGATAGPTKARPAVARPRRAGPYHVRPCPSGRSARSLKQSPCVGRIRTCCWPENGTDSVSARRTPVALSSISGIRRERFVRGELRDMRSS